MFITVALIPLLIRYAYRFELVDLPNERKVHVSAIPRVGGIAIVIGTLIPIFIWLADVADVYYLIAAMTVLLCFGAWDDTKDIDYRLKLAGQFLAAIIVVFFCDVKIRWLPFLPDYQLPDYFSIPLSIMTLIGVTNAVNFSDGLDGLAGGTTLLSFSLVAVISYIIGDFTLLIVSLAVMGSLLGFLRYNTHPASIFMGDAGSQFLGFTIATLTILLTQKSDIGLSPVLPLLLLGIPIFDTITVIAIRLYRRRSPFSPDRNHLHHQLLDAGFHHYDVVMLLYIMQGFLTVASFLLRYQNDALLLSTYLLFCASLLTFLYWQKKRRRLGLKVKFTATQRIKQRYKRDFQGATLIIENLISIALPIIIVVSANASMEVEGDILLLSYVLLLASAGCFFLIRSENLYWIERVHIYVLCSLAIYFYHYIPNEKMSIHDFLTVTYIFLFLAVVMVFQFSAKKGFKITTLDYLVIFLAFLLPTLSTIGEAISGAASISIMIILFYIVEYILTSFHISARQIRGLAMLSNLCVVASLLF